MAYTHFTGPVASANGFETGTSANPITETAAGNVSQSYVTTSATDGDTRLSYNKLTFTAAGSGETIRAFTVLTAAGTAPGGTVNGIHASLEAQGGNVSGAANAVRATLGGSTVGIGGTIAALQLDTNFTGSATVTGNSAFIRVSDSGAVTGAVANLFNIETGPAATIAPTASAVTTVSKALKVRIGSTVYYVPAYATFTP